MNHPQNQPERDVSRDEFARIVMDHLHRTKETVTVRYDREHFRLRGDNDEELNLDTLHDVYRANDDQSREKLLSDIARMWFREDYALPEEFADATHDLLPYVHARGFFEVHSRRWPYRVLGEHFGVGLAFERLECRQLVTQADLDAWGVSLDEALEIAKETLRQLPANVARQKSGEGVCWLATGDDRDSSRLLLTDIIREWNMKGDTIAMVPHRDTLLIAGSEDRRGLAQMVEMAMATGGFPRPISGIALRLDGDEWKPWLPPPSHPSYDAFRGLHLRTLGQEYAEQEQLLNRPHEHTDEGMLATEFVAMRSPAGSYWSWATCVAEGTLLPITDLVIFAPPTSKTLVPVEWQKVVDVMGDLLEPLDMYPPRYRMRALPSEEQLARMLSEHHAE